MLMAMNTSHEKMATTIEASEVAKRLDFGDDSGGVAEAQEMDLNSATEKLGDIARYQLSQSGSSILKMRLTRSPSLGF